MFGIDFTLFLLTGIIAYDFFSSVLAQCAGAIEANEGLFVYKQVKPFDVVITRVILEFLIHLGSFLLLLAVAAWLGSSVAPADPFGLLLLVVLLFVFSAACGLSIAIGTRLLPEMRKIIPFLTRPLFFISGIFFPLAAIPEDYRGLLLWNPILHFLELIREAYFASYVNTGASWWAVLGATLAASTLALVLYRRYRIALVTT
jgi:capsular polysaccharide transport system permease protein